MAIIFTEAHINTGFTSRSCALDGAGLEVTYANPYPASGQWIRSQAFAGASTGRGAHLSSRSAAQSRRSRARRIVPAALCQVCPVAGAHARARQDQRRLFLRI